MNFNYSELFYTKNYIDKYIDTNNKYNGNTREF